MATSQPSIADHPYLVIETAPGERTEVLRHPSAEEAILRAGRAGASAASLGLAGHGYAVEAWEPATGCRPLVKEAHRAR